MVFWCYLRVTMRRITSIRPVHNPYRRLWVAAGLAWPWMSSAAAEMPDVLRFGLTPVFLDDRVRLLRRWMGYLFDALGVEVRIVQFGTYAQMIDAIRAGQVDFAWICGYPYVLHRREMRLVGVPIWRGRPLYQSYLIADKASTVRTVDDLRGRTFAYADPLSNSGFLFVQYLLREQRHDPARHFKRSFFTNSHRHVVDAVSHGLAEAGAVDGYVWETLAELSPAVTSRTRVMLRSHDFGFPPIVAPLATPPAVVERFARALVGMASVQTGRAILSDLRLDGFARAMPGLFDSIEAMTRQHRG